MLKLLSLLKTSWFPYVGGASVVFALLYVSNLRVQVISLEKEVGQLETEIMLAEVENLGLGESLKYQNQKVRELERLSDENQAKTESLLVRLRSESVERVNLIDRLKKSEARTCEQGIALIDEALGL